MTTILILGATGITGRRIAQRLARPGLSIRAASRRAAAEHTPFDWADPASQRAALAGVDALYLVPEPLVVDPSPRVAALLELAAQAGVRRVVACSSLGATFPDEPADSGRRAMERAIEGSPLAWTMLRPGGFMQNFSEGFLLPGILQAGAVVSATGDGAAALVDADDIADVAIAALLDERHAGQRYALTGPAALSFADAMATISAVAGRRLEHRAISSRELAGMLEGFGIPPAYAAMLVRDQEAIRDGLGAAISGDVERVLGRAPRSFARFADEAAPAWRG